jgi:hypothetical protein
MSRQAWLCLLASSTGAAAGVLAREAFGPIEAYCTAGVLALGSLAAVNRLDGVGSKGVRTAADGPRWDDGPDGG